MFGMLSRVMSFIAEIDSIPRRNIIYVSPKGVSE
jgi:hypothetical protein